MSGTVINVTEHIAGSELVESPTALYPSTSLYPSAELVPGGGPLYPSESTFPSPTLYPSGASTLEVADLGEFDLDGGQLTIGIETHYYAVLGDGAQADGSGFLQLADSLTGTYRAGEPVYEYPRVVERWADVLEPNGEETLRVRVPHALYALLPLGIREPDAGEQVTFAEDGTDTVITDVLGLSPDGFELQENTTLAGNGARRVKWVGTDNGRSQFCAVGYNSGDGFHRGFIGMDPQTWPNTTGINFRADGVSDLISIQAGAVAQTLLRKDGSSDWLIGDIWRDWTPTFVGWSANPTGGVYRYRQIGNVVIALIRQPNDGTSNSVNTSISAPVTAATGTDYQWEAAASAKDNGAFLTTPARAGIASGSSTITFGKDYSTVVGGWTAANGKRIANCTLIYEAA